MRGKFAAGLPSPFAPWQPAHGAMAFPPPLRASCSPACGDDPAELLPAAALALPLAFPEPPALAGPLALVFAAPVDEPGAWANTTAAASARPASADRVSIPCVLMRAPAAQAPSGID